MNDFKVTDKIAGLLKKYLSIDFEFWNSKYPLSICPSCHLCLFEREKNILSRPLPVAQLDFENIILPMPTRSRDYECNCVIYITGRKKGLLKSQRRKKTGSYKGNRITLCKLCFSPLGKGLVHNCVSSKQPDNVVKMIDTVPAVQKEQVSL